ncbi:RNA polymerase sigma factor [Anaeromyxobacter sp. Fw109-5]|uniref:RNA polymerase sigma factor n=1 Tax=Anaeromyxobacter sp. (strain Fw109-5) TaxID=404589 RepID=UPI0002E551CB|nr:sigma-70 family RNA polymerase sigma factor [Anaeromyxobacter sp. Fw109-5]
MIAVAAVADLRFALSWQVEERSLGPPVMTGEAALARSAAKGDRKAFGQLVDVHKRAVFGLCFRLLRHPEEARDAAQETFARAFAALSTYDPGQPFAPWVLRIARNHCLDVLRRRLPEAQQFELDAEPEDGAPRELADPAAERGDEALERRQLAGALEAAVAALPQNYREVVHLFHVEHLSYKEIAATLDVPIGTVMTWLHRARARLKTALAEPGAEVTR